MEFDTLIGAELVVDDSGQMLATRADVGITGGRVAAVGALDGATVERTSAGQGVAPSFIDVQGHSELALLCGSRLYGALAQGVTTQLLARSGRSCHQSGHARCASTPAWPTASATSRSIGRPRRAILPSAWAIPPPMLSRRCRTVPCAGSRAGRLTPDTIPMIRFDRRDIMTAVRCLNHCEGESGKACAVSASVQEE
jgi:hypothetical protein